MKVMTRFVIVLALLAACSGAWARGSWGHYHRYGGSSVRLGFYVGSPWWGPWWGAPTYYYNYAPPVVMQPSVPLEMPTVQAPAANSYWYFCRAANAYYPYVRSCPSGWEQVTPTPPAP
jgi:hypothetical protein